ncbi:uncharacterized protein BO96DRAFT_439468 [Aspergillus niger CBS 101883]|uniref:uncharacterized protein n=1 Tax=Aspergillus lacticoffeatus (strain CBS 101883) TaxID=1450533 RepID=UPI000D7FAFA8|nr:uncharacterized protein BO96DRAFT_439468 [Aspergillus niger CBS 101883]PYH50946.1 hypothetical protein BO96DRAFT_439468 [Aspergillus niger CBS 101883]
MSDFNDREQLVKRKREDWAGPGPAHYNNDKTSKTIEPSQQPSKILFFFNEEVASISPAIKSFYPPIRELEQRLDDNKLRLCESYVAQHAKCSRLEKKNGQLQIAHARLVNENTQLNRRYRDEEARLCHFREAIQKMRDSVIDMIETCKNFKMTEGPAAGGADGPTHEQEKVAVIVPVVHVQEDQGTSTSH